MNLNRIEYSFFIAIFFLLGCSRFGRIQKSDNLDLKYKAAIEYFNNKKYNKSSTLLEELIPTLKGQADAEKAQFYYAYSQYYQNQLILSAYYFKRFYETYPRSELAEEANYMQCLSLFEDSPDFELDQTNTLSALTALQAFLDRYPRTKYLDKVNQMIDQLNFKLEQKAYHQSKLFYKMRDYRASVICFENFTKDFPNSKFLEEVAFLKIVAQKSYAEISIESKKRERFAAATDFYYLFIDKYSSSKYIKEAEKLFEEIQVSLSEIDRAEPKRKKWWHGLI